MRRALYLGGLPHSTNYVSLILLFCALLTKANAMDISELKGRWVLEAINGRNVTFENLEIYFEITERTITGYDGCNRFGGSTAQPFIIQRSQRACPPETILLPLDLSDPAPQLSRATVSGDKLFLPLPDSKGEAQFRRTHQK
jgi:META domain